MPNNYQYLKEDLVLWSMLLTRKRHTDNQKLLNTYIAKYQYNKCHNYKKWSILLNFCIHFIIN